MVSLFENITKPEPCAIIWYHIIIITAYFQLYGVQTGAPRDIFFSLLAPYLFNTMWWNQLGGGGVMEKKL